MFNKTYSDGKKRTKRTEDIKYIKDNVFGHCGCYCEALSIVPLGHYAMRGREDIPNIVPQGNDAGR